MEGSSFWGGGVVSGSNETLLLTFGRLLLLVAAGSTSEEYQMYNFSYEEPPHLMHKSRQSWIVKRATEPDNGLNQLQEPRKQIKNDL